MSEKPVVEVQAEHSGIVDPRGRPARRQQVGQPCVDCGENRVKPVMGGSCICMKCGYQE